MHRPNAGILGIGMLLLLPATATVPTGRLSRKQWRALVRTLLGGADRYGVLYRTPATATLKTRSWMGQFTGGYRCGKGFKPPKRSFEGFNPIPCTQLLIRLGPFKSMRWVNWN